MSYMRCLRGPATLFLNAFLCVHAAQASFVNSGELLTQNLFVNPPTDTHKNKSLRALDLRDGPVATLVRNQSGGLTGNLIDPQSDEGGSLFEPRLDEKRRWDNLDKFTREQLLALLALDEELDAELFGLLKALESENDVLGRPFSQGDVFFGFDPTATESEKPPSEVDHVELAAILRELGKQGKTERFDFDTVQGSRDAGLASTSRDTTWLTDRVLFGTKQIDMRERSWLIRKVHAVIRFLYHWRWIIFAFAGLCLLYRKYLRTSAYS